MDISCVSLMKAAGSTSMPVITANKCSGDQRVTPSTMQSPKTHRSHSWQDGVEAINYNSHSPLVLMNGTLTSTMYVIQPVLLPLLQQEGDVLFQQDNASPHTHTLHLLAYSLYKSLPYFHDQNDLQTCALLSMCGMSWDCTSLILVDLL